MNTPFNNFKVGDIVEICFDPRQEPQEWHRFSNNPIRDANDLKQVKEIVETDGACLGWGSAALVNAGNGHKFRTVTP